MYEKTPIQYAVTVPLMDDRANVWGPFPSRASAAEWISIHAASFQRDASITELFSVQQWLAG